jgi:Mor family transcriptional regulator
VTRRTPRQKARVDQLAEELAIGAAMQLRCDSSEIHDVVKAVVDYLVKEYPAQDLYIPAGFTADHYPVDRIRTDLAAGKSIRWVCKKYRISRKTLYPLLDRPSSRTGT